MPFILVFNIVVGVLLAITMVVILGTIILGRDTKGQTSERVEKQRLVISKVKSISYLVFFAIMIIMIAVGILISPVSSIFVYESSKSALLQLLIISVGSIVYIVLHELIHGLFMYLFSKVRAKYGFTGLYAYAGSDAYFAKAPYIVIALAPIVVLGIVLLILNILLPSSFFWSIYIIQITNISGAAGDLYVTFKFTKLPRDILVRDDGVAMTVYAPLKAEN